MQPMMQPMEPTSTSTTELLTFIGIDVSKSHLDAAMYPVGEAWQLRLSNDEAGVQQLVDRLSQMHPQPQLVVLEATGGLEQAAAAAAAAALAVAGLAVAVVNPRQVRDFARATGKLAKTDTLDAGVLAHFAQAVHPQPRPLADEAAQALNAILERRRQVVEMHTAEGNRVRTASRVVRGRIEAHIERRT